MLLLRQREPARDGNPLLKWLAAQCHAYMSLGVVVSPDEETAEDTAALLLEVDKVLETKAVETRFSEAIRVRFDQASREAYADLFLRLSILGTVIFDLFLFVDAMVVPDVIDLATGLQIFIGTPVALVAMLSIKKFDVDASHAAMVTLFTMSGCVVAIFMASRSEHIGLFPAVFPLFLISANVAQALPFRWALTFTGLFTCIVTIAVLLHPSLDKTTKYFSIVILISAAQYSLAGNFRINAGVRRAYLFALRESLRAQLLAQSNSELETMVDIDALTQIGNRRQFDKCIENVCRGDGRGSVAVLMIDIDHFKRLNDSFGHQAGDACLRQVAQSLAEGLGGLGTVARYGGEEFAAILLGFHFDAVLGIADNLRRKVQSLTVRLDGGSEVQVTISIGCAAGTLGTITKPVDLIAAADAALYLAKQCGRNRVQAAVANQIRLPTFRAFESNTSSEANAAAV